MINVIVARCSTGNDEIKTQNNLEMSKKEKFRKTVVLG
jgi:hypothetical protein